MAWTEDQQNVIDSRGGNLLVAAAAGSGKTAVLVERIIGMLCEEENPIDIDHLLVVTFTNAAAAEMRDRIGNAINKKLEEIPHNEHLRKQASYIHRAQITTIHSFCLWVIRNHFNQLSIDPNFRIGEEAELSLLKSDVLKELLEQKYIEADPDFLMFVESYARGKTDKAIEDIILNMHEFSRSYPRPKLWLAHAKEVFEIEDKETLSQSAFMQNMLKRVKVELNEVREQLLLALAICEGPAGPLPYEKTIRLDIELLDELMGGRDYDGFQERFEQGKFSRLSGRIGEETDKNKQAVVKKIRDDVRSRVAKLKTEMFSRTSEEILKELLDVRPAMDALIQTVMEFDTVLKEAKLKKNLMDFSDLEHYALSILVAGYDEDQNPIASETAKEISLHFEEIMIDEYQDSNLIQEEILNSISRAHSGHNNVFMVGDVKQSIYKFRLARPELFIEKYNRYPSSGGKACPEKKIELSKNFRSREEVLHSVNLLFYQLMGEDLGGVSYTKKAALDPGMKFAETDGATGGRSELLIGDMAAKEEMLEKLYDETKEEATMREMEAKLIADRIQELIHGNDPQYVWDKEKESYRKASYRDIVILLRTVSGWADVFEEVLMREGIPAHCDSQTGYFSTVEIQNVLSLMSIIDNVYLDIPMAAVLHSPMVGLTGEELAVIRSGYKLSGAEDQSLYTQIELYAMEGENENIKEKLAPFLDLLEELRESKTYLSLHDLIWLALDRTGYYYYAGAMPQGKKRQANLLMLIEKACQYENSSYKGLFHFIRYINQLKQYNIDFGEARILGDGEDVVRIMSIHKSKGLEFPIVFVSGLAKSFNQMDARNTVVMHPDFYIGPDHVDLEYRIRKPTLVKQVIQKNMVLETLGEELRILYVALTRAREKLIMTGVVKDWDKLRKEKAYVRYQKGSLLDYFARAGAASYLQWIVSALVRPQKLIEEKVVPVTCMMIKETMEAVKEVALKDELLLWEKEELSQNRLRSCFEWEYPYAKEVAGKSKFTVSEMKKLSQQGEIEETPSLMREETVNLMPAFLEEEKPISPTSRGTAVHKLLELFDFAKASPDMDIKQELKSLQENKKLPEEYLSLLHPSSLAKLLRSSIGKRLTKAAQVGKLHKEAQYVMGIPLKEADPSSTSEELVLIQGIIDLYFEEEDGLVILDYKTDRIDKGGEKLLAERYRIQLDYYKKALEQMTGRKVKETYIYSFSLGKEIRIA